jgi:hypothetical protein
MLSVPFWWWHLRAAARDRPELHGGSVPAPIDEEVG